MKGMTAFGELIVLVVLVGMLYMFKPSYKADMDSAVSDLGNSLVRLGNALVVAVNR